MPPGYTGAGGAGGAEDGGGGAGATGTDWSINPETGEPTFTGVGGTTYTPGEGGAPSVGYPVNPYSSPGNQNGQWMQTDNNMWYYTDYTGRTYGPYTDKSQLDPNAVTSPTAGKGHNEGSSMSQLINQGVQFSSQEAQSDNAVKEMYMKSGGAAAWGSIEEYAKQHGLAWYGTISSTDLVGQGVKDYTWNQERPGAYPSLGRKDLPNYPSLAVGGLIGQGGLFEGHAGEIVSPIEKILPAIREGNNTTTVEGNKEVTFNITINGNADSRTTDEMINKIKRELFGVGWA